MLAPAYKLTFVAHTPHRDGSAGRDYGEASRQIMSNISVIIEKLVLINSGEDTALARFNSRELVFCLFPGTVLFSLQRPRFLSQQ